MLLLFPLPIFALERFPFLSLSILYTCICSFSMHSAVATCSNPIVYDLHLCDFLPETNSSFCPSMPSFQSLGRHSVVLVFVPLLFALTGSILNVSVHSFAPCQLPGNFLDFSRTLAVRFRCTALSLAFRWQIQFWCFFLSRANAACRVPLCLSSKPRPVCSIHTVADRRRRMILFGRSCIT